MALLVFLKREGFGTYKSIDEFVGELARRSTSALGGLAAVLSSKSPEDVREAAQGDAQNVCVELVRDLRAPKGARVAALRALMLAGVGASLPSVFAGAADLLADARVADADRAYLAKTGLQRFLESLEPQKVSLEVARGAATAVEAVRLLGADIIQEVIAPFPASHVGVITVRHAALRSALPAELRLRWLELLATQYRAAKNASPAAKRLGRAPEWPPVVPEVFRPLLEEAEKNLPIPTPSGEPPGTAGTSPDAATARTAGGPKHTPVVERARTRPSPGSGTREFRGPDKLVDTEQLRWGPELRAIPVGALRFAPQVALLATRGVRALERTVGAFDARSAQVGVDAALAELSAAAVERGPPDVNQPMMDELLAFAMDKKSTPSWRRAARVLLDALSPDRAATLPELPDIKPVGRRSF